MRDILARHHVQQHTAGRRTQPLSVKLHGRDGRGHTSQQLAVVQAGQPHLFRYTDMAIAQLAHQIKGQAIIAAEQAFGLLLQRSLQCVGALLVGFNAGADQLLVGVHPTVASPRR